MPLLWGLAASPKRYSFIRDFGRRDCGTASSGTLPWTQRSINQRSKGETHLSYSPYAQSVCVTFVTPGQASM